MISADKEIVHVVQPQQHQTIEHIFHIPEGESAQVSVVFDVHKRASITYHPIIIGGSIDLTITLNLVGEYARGTIQGAYALCNKHRAMINTTQHHEAPHTESSLEINGVLNDASRMHYNGMIYIAKDAHNVDADQQNKTLLLSPKAHARSIPSIEVLNNDVLCAHGSAISYLDGAQLLYLQSRGVAQKGAQQILLDGFLSSILSGVSEEARQLCKKHVLK